MARILSQLAGLDGFQLFFLQWYVLFIPFLAIASHRRLRGGRPLAPKTRRLVTGLVIQTLGLALTINAARDLPLSLGVAGGEYMILAAAGVSFLLVAAFRGWAKAPEAHRERVKLLFMAEKPAHFVLLAMVSVLAGVGEELAYRGVLFLMLMGLGVPVLLDLLICTALFGVAHIAQGWRGVVGSAWMGLIFHMLVIGSNSLLPAIFMHTAYDLVLLLSLPYREARRMATVQQRA